MLNTVHLRVLDQDPVEHEGFGFGCDYGWSADYSYYRLLPHRWSPYDPDGYANYQAGTLAWQIQNETDDE